MALSHLWLNDRGQIQGKQIHQIIAFAGDGKLKDSSASSAEFREFLALVPPETLCAYATQCLEEKFLDSGFALQDVINEIGKRLGFLVEFGRYRGVANEIGCDGIWTSDDGFSIIVEVKTTDHGCPVEEWSAARKSLKGRCLGIVLGVRDLKSGSGFRTMGGDEYRPLRTFADSRSGALADTFAFGHTL